MLFNSIEFLIFFPIVVTIYFLLPYKLRIIFLLLASYVFYMTWRIEYVLLLVASTLVDYFVSRKLGITDNKNKRRVLLGISLTVNLGLLFTFKYFGFFTQTISEILSIFGIVYVPKELGVLLPIGISFYTFQTLGYTIDVYRKKFKPVKSFPKFALYVSFFPQLVAGPIERAKNLIPQFNVKHRFEPDRVTDGLKLMVWGLFKKVVIADSLAIYVNTVYNNVEDYAGLPLIIATVFFAVQIYCDFSGYTDIAIGAAKIMGFDLMKNFKRPYFAKSIPEFWQRWHISLSSWFKDYVYIPLGGNRVYIDRWIANILMVFLLSGLWHGANWTFVIWGGLHGVYMIVPIILMVIILKIKNIPYPKSTDTFLKKYIKLKNFSVPSLIKILVTFLLVLLGWIFFRANSISDAIYILNNLFNNWSLENIDISLGMNKFIWFNVIVLVMLLIEALEEKYHIWKIIMKKYNWLQYPIFLILCIFILFFGESSTEFIYFQF